MNETTPFIPIDERARAMSEYLRRFKFSFTVTAGLSLGHQEVVLDSPIKHPSDILDELLIELQDLRCRCSEKGQ